MLRECKIVSTGGGLIVWRYRHLDRGSVSEKGIAIGVNGDALPKVGLRLTCDCDRASALGIRLKRRVVLLHRTTIADE